MFIVHRLASNGIVLPFSLLPGTIQNRHERCHPAAAVQTGQFRFAKAFHGKCRHPITSGHRASGCNESFAQPGPPRITFLEQNSLNIPFCATTVSPCSLPTASNRDPVEGRHVHASGHQLPLGLGGKHQRGGSGHRQLLPRAARFRQSPADVPLPANCHGLLDAGNR